MISRRTSSVPNEDVVFSHSALQLIKVLPDLSPVFPGLSPAIPGASMAFVGAPSYSDGWQECPPAVWYSPEIDAYQFSLHILPETSGGFQRLKYIFLMLSDRSIRIRSHLAVLFINTYCAGVETRQWW